MLLPYLFLVVIHFGFDGGILFMIAPVPSHCLPFTFRGGGGGGGAKFDGRVSMM